jgi:hypothetical protein|tara:strand:- start:760 stop:1341 length:582 start_codon:yes stop_codon:yes gene_type:complete
MIDIIVLKSLFLLFLVMAGSFIGDIFNCTLKNLLTNNIYIKHLVFICLIYFTIDFTDDKRKHPFKIFKLTIILWIFYMMAIRMNIFFSIIVFILLFLLYIIDEYYEYIVQEELKFHIEKIDDKKKKKEKEKHLKILQEKHNYLKKINESLEYIIIITVLIGFILYFIKQYKDKKSKFSYSKFILGDLTCRWEK